MSAPGAEAVRVWMPVAFAPFRPSGLLARAILDAARIQTVELPPEQDLHERIRFVVAALTPRGRPFTRFLLGAPARRVLLEAGFV